VCDVPDRRRRLTSRGWPRWRVRMPRVPVFGRVRPCGSGSWAWLEPYPGPPRGAPAEPSMSLAFIAALQRLPPRERAALILSDVLNFAAAEVAEILDCDVAAVDQMLLRARKEAGAAPRPAPDEDAVVTRFTGAFERGDMAGIAALLSRNASLRMRPLPVEYRGRSAARYFLAVVAFPGGTPSYRLIATRANGQPAFGCYLKDPAAGIDHACGLVVLTVDGGRIAAIDRFVDNSMLPRFGLPRTLPEAR
jgi:RNA polymerase sigma-70 factor, ECF subfamily